MSQDIWVINQEVRVSPVRSTVLPWERRLPQGRETLGGLAQFMGMLWADAMRHELRKGGERRQREAWERGCEVHAYVQAQGD